MFVEFRTFQHEIERKVSMRRIEVFDFGIYNPYKMSNAAVRTNRAVKEGKVFFTEDFFDPKSPRMDEEFDTV